ncbi:MAG: xylulokinase [Halioglobus sp.]|jgi:xylulokinase
MYLGIDIGTQSVKTLILDAQNSSVAAVASAPLELISESDGTREQHAHWWIDALKRCLAGIDPKLLAAIEAIGVSGQQHGFVPVDKQGKVLAPVKLWCDTATTNECEQITAAYGGAAKIIADVGNAIVPGYTAPKIRWLKNNRPELYQQLHMVLLPHDYLNFYLSGELAMEWGDASGTGLLDIRSRNWHAGILLAIDAERDLTDCLPSFVAPDQAMGQLHQQAAEEFGLPAGTPISAGGGDNMMAALGTGNVVAGRLTVSLGTSGTLFAFSDTPVIDPSGQLAAFCSSTGGWLPLLCTMNCTVATELSRQLLGADLEACEQLVNQSPAGAEGIVTLPFFNGERTPNLPNGKGCILGLDDQNYSASNLMRSAMESATFGLRAGSDAFFRLGCELNEIRLTGGGSQSAAWRQMVADVFNLPVTVLANDEGAALGAALQALWMHSGVEPAALAEQHLQKDEARCCIPRSDVAALYAGFYQRYLNHVEHLTPLYAQ